jgi:hypothetical protein
MVTPLDLRRLQVYPLASRESLTTAAEIRLDPDSPPQPCSEVSQTIVARCAEALRAAKARGAARMLMYGAHLLRNGAVSLLERLMANGWITHLATNGAGTIHDWEYAWFGASTESVEMGVANGRFGTWHETSTNLHLAMMVGALDGLGYGRSLGRLIMEDGAVVPTIESLRTAIATQPDDPLTAARADLLQSLLHEDLASGRVEIHHRWKEASILAQAWKHHVPLTVHPGIGYDIIANHPIFNGAVIGRGADLDFRMFGGSVAELDGGVVMSIGSAIMAPQVFEKSLSCVNNLRLQSGQPVIQNHQIFVVDLQDGGNWDWTQGEPPKTNPAYYLRFCKSFSRMGAAMHYAQCDNATFVHRLYRELCR